MIKLFAVVLLSFAFWISLCFVAITRDQQDLYVVLIVVGAFVTGVAFTMATMEYLKRGGEMIYCEVCKSEEWSLGGVCMGCDQRDLRSLNYEL